MAWLWCANKYAFYASHCIFFSSIIYLKIRNFFFLVRRQSTVYQQHTIPNGWMLRWRNIVHYNVCKFFRSMHYNYNIHRCTCAHIYYYYGIERYKSQSMRDYEHTSAALISYIHSFMAYMLLRTFASSSYANIGHTG